MTQNQRNSFERSTLAGSGERIRRGSEKGAGTYVLLALPVAVIGCVMAVSILDTWWQWVVLASIVTTTVGLMIAVNPERKA